MKILRTFILILFLLLLVLPTSAKCDLLQTLKNRPPKERFDNWNRSRKGTFGLNNEHISMKWSDRCGEGCDTMLIEIGILYRSGWDGKVELEYEFEDLGANRYPNSNYFTQNLGLGYNPQNLTFKNSYVTRSINHPEITVDRVKYNAPIALNFASLIVYLEENTQEPEEEYPIPTPILTLPQPYSPTPSPEETEIEIKIETERPMFLTPSPSPTIARIPTASATPTPSPTVNPSSTPALTPTVTSTPDITKSPSPTTARGTLPIKVITPPTHLTTPSLPISPVIPITPPQPADRRVYHGNPWKNIRDCNDFEIGKIFEKYSINGQIQLFGSNGLFNNADIISDKQYWITVYNSREGKSKIISAMVLRQRILFYIATHGNNYNYLDELGQRISLNVAIARINNQITNFSDWFDFEELEESGEQVQNLLGICRANSFLELTPATLERTKKLISLLREKDFDEIKWLISNGRIDIQFFATLNFIQLVDHIDDKQTFVKILGVLMHLKKIPASYYLDVVNKIYG